MVSSVAVVLSEVRYAMRQLGKFDDGARALDALERVEERLHVVMIAAELERVHRRIQGERWARAVAAWCRR